MEEWKEYKLGEIARIIGAGRLSKEDTIDYEVGLVLSKKIGDFVNDGEELLKIYIKDKDFNINDCLDCFKIDSDLKKKEPLIYEIIK